AQLGAVGTMFVRGGRRGRVSSGCGARGHRDSWASCPTDVPPSGVLLCRPSLDLAPFVAARRSPILGTRSHPRCGVVAVSQVNWSGSLGWSTRDVGPWRGTCCAPPTALEGVSWRNRGPSSGVCRLVQQLCDAD